MGQSPQLVKLFQASRNCELPTAKLQDPEANPQFVNQNSDQLIITLAHQNIKIYK
jgi:hypothetical protein